MAVITRVRITAGAFFVLLILANLAFMTRIVSVCILVFAYLFYCLGGGVTRLSMVTNNPGSFLHYKASSILLSNDFVISHIPSIETSVNQSQDTNQSQQNNVIDAKTPILEKGRRDERKSRNESKGITNRGIQQRKIQLQSTLAPFTCAPIQNSMSAENTVSNRSDKEKQSKHIYEGTIVYYPSRSGFGNNLYGLISAFVIGALTNRQIVGRNRLCLSSRNE